MTPYYDQDGITIYHGDCREVIHSLPAFQAVIADPPYNVGLAYGRGFVDAMPVDEYRRFCREWFYPCMGRAESVLVTPGSSNLPYWAAFEPSWIYCWTTASETPGGRVAMRLGWEPLVAFGFPRKPFGTDVLNYAIGKQEGVGGHPCPKPLSLFQMMIDRWAADDAVILDPFVGSGTTLLAAKMEGRKAIGIDVNEQYCEIAAKRLAQGVLFGAA